MPTSSSGALPRKARIGIVIYEASGNVIGGTTPGAGNVISDNESEIEIMGTQADGNTVIGNLIGTDASGNPLYNDSGGVNGRDNQIGGLLPGKKNIISVGSIGVSVGGIGNVLAGNHIGLPGPASAAGRFWREPPGDEYDGDKQHDRLLLSRPLS